MGDVGQIVPLNVAIGDERLLPAFLAGNDALVNCVGILRESGSQTFELAHHIGPGRLAGFAREAGVERFVHISAIGADPRSTSAYARTKAAGERAVRDAFPTVTILRPSVVFGPEDQFFNRFAAMAMIAAGAAADRRRRNPVSAGLCRRRRRRRGQMPRGSGDGGTHLRARRSQSVHLPRAPRAAVGARSAASAGLSTCPFGLAASPGAADVDSPQPAADAGPGRAPEERQHRLFRGDDPGEPRHRADPVEMILPTYLDRFRRGGAGPSGRPRP